MTVPAHPLDGGDCTDEGGFEAFFERWYPSVLSYARRFGATQAEEIAQETLFRAFNCFSELRLDMPLPWLRTVARNVACDMYRAGTRLWPLPEPGDADPADSSEGPEESLLRLERVRHMRAALGDISAEDRRLLHMLVVDENSVADVADQLSVTANVVRVRLHRARRRLGDHYVRRAGRRVLAFPLLAVVGLRRLLRPATSTATRSAPALAAVAALGGLTAATVVLSQPSLPQQSWSSASAQQQAYRHGVPTDVPRRSAAVPAKAPSTRHSVSPAATTSRPSGPRIDAGVSRHPLAPGESAHEHIVVATPVGTVGIDERQWRAYGDGLVCGRVAALPCN